MNRLIGIAVFVLSLILGWGWMSYQQSIDSTHIAEDRKSVVILVPKGSTFKQVVEQLTAAQAIEPFWFKLLVRIEGAAGKIQAGEYEFSPGMTPRQILEAMVNGKVVLYAITFVEGETFKLMLRELRAHPAIEQTLPDTKDHQAILRALDISEQHPEGVFLPETYFFPRGTTDRDLLRRAYHAMQTYMTEAWSNRDENLPLKSPYEALILASIVEKESAVAEERSLIAGVFIKRLLIGMKLQTDPTVIYGMGDAYKGNIRLRDLRKDTPYNTYTRYGLPPTPIAMPSRAAIDAVLHPIVGDSLFFVSRGNGTHVFSATLKEHNRAVDTFQRKK